MNREEIFCELKMNYYELVDYLINKYGEAKYDYFYSSLDRIPNRKVSRTSEGLYCHHIDEDKGGNLSDYHSAIRQPFKWQKKERLVYCNIIEHLILHIKIIILRQKGLLKKPNDIHAFFSTGGVFIICREINDMFMTDGTEYAWKQRCYEEIKDNYNEYIILLNILLTYIENNYCAEKDDSVFLVPGSFAQFSDCKCEILKISKSKQVLVLRHPNGEEVKMHSRLAVGNQLKYKDEMNMTTSSLSLGEEKFYDNIFNDILNCANQEIVSEYADVLKIDYLGYGFPKYSHFMLSEDYGAESADEYISNAFPAYSELPYDLSEKTPKFVKGKSILTEARDNFYVVRIKTTFEIKEGYTPFVRYKKIDFLRPETIKSNTENWSFIDREGVVLSTSDIYDERTNTYYSHYTDYNNKFVAASVIVTLTKNDFLLFKKHYNVRYYRILDGCYFI